MLRIITRKLLEFTCCSIKLFYGCNYVLDTVFVTVSNINTSQIVAAGNTKGGSITVPLTSCLTGLESAV
jgi:hypothetical protein